MKDLKIGCGKPTGSSVGASEKKEIVKQATEEGKEVRMSRVRVGAKAPDFGAFQHVRETKGAEATPSGWVPGRPTLKPGPDLVGRVWEAWKVENAF